MSTFLKIDLFKGNKIVSKYRVAKYDLSKTNEIKRFQEFDLDEATVPHSKYLSYKLTNKKHFKHSDKKLVEIKNIRYLILRDTYTKDFYIFFYTSRKDRKDDVFNKIQIMFRRKKRKLKKWKFVKTNTFKVKKLKTSNRRKHKKLFAPKYVYFEDLNYLLKEKVNMVEVFFKEIFINAVLSRDNSTLFKTKDIKSQADIDIFLNNLKTVEPTLKMNKYHLMEEELRSRNISVGNIVFVMSVSSKHTFAYFSSNTTNKSDIYSKHKLKIGHKYFTNSNLFGEIVLSVKIFNIKRKELKIRKCLIQAYSFNQKNILLNPENSLDYYARKILQISITDTFENIMKNTCMELMKFQSNILNQTNRLHVTYFLLNQLLKSSTEKQNLDEKVNENFYAIVNYQKKAITYSIEVMNNIFNVNKILESILGVENLEQIPRILSAQKLTKPQHFEDAEEKFETYKKNVQVETKIINKEMGKTEQDRTRKHKKKEMKNITENKENYYGTNENMKKHSKLHQNIEDQNENKISFTVSSRILKEKHENNIVKKLVEKTPEIKETVLRNCVTEKKVSEVQKKCAVKKLCENKVDLIKDVKSKVQNENFTEINVDNMKKSKENINETKPKSNLSKKDKKRVKTSNNSQNITRNSKHNSRESSNIQVKSSRSAKEKLINEKILNTLTEKFKKFDTHATELAKHTKNIQNFLRHKNNINPNSEVQKSLEKLETAKNIRKEMYELNNKINNVLNKFEANKMQVAERKKLILKKIQDNLKIVQERFEKNTTIIKNAIVVSEKIKRLQKLKKPEQNVTNIERKEIQVIYTRDDQNFNVLEKRKRVNKDNSVQSTRVRYSSKLAPRLSNKFGSKNFIQTNIENAFRRKGRSSKISNRAKIVDSNTNKKNKQVKPVIKSKNFVCCGKYYRPVPPENFSIKSLRLSNLSLRYVQPYNSEYPRKDNTNDVGSSFLFSLVETDNVSDTILLPKITCNRKSCTNCAHLGDSKTLLKELSEDNLSNLTDYSSDIFLEPDLKNTKDKQLEQLNKILDLLPEKSQNLRNQKKNNSASTIPKNFKTCKRPVITSSRQTRQSMASTRSPTVTSKNPQRVISTSQKPQKPIQKPTKPIQKQAEKPQKNDIEQYIKKVEEKLLKTFNLPEPEQKEAFNKLEHEIKYMLSVLNSNETKENLHLKIIKSIERLTGKQYLPEEDKKKTK